MVARSRDDLVRLVDETARVDEFDGIERASTDVALVTAGVVGATMRASPFYETICKEPRARDQI